MSRIPLIMSLAILLTGCASNPSEGPSQEAPPAIPVLTASVEVKDVPVYFESIGTLQPSIQIEIRPQVNGTLTTIHAKDGDWVEKGTPLFSVDSKVYEIRVTEAEAQLALDVATHEAAKKTYDRFKNLAQKDLLAQTEWDEIETQVAKSKAQIQADEARLKGALLDFERCSITAPSEGRIGKIHVHEGCLVSASQPTPLVVLAKMNPLIVEFTLTENELRELPPEAKTLEIEPLTSIEPKVIGQLSFLDNHFDPATGLILAKGVLENSQLALRPGQSVRVKLPIAVKAQAKLIPQKAVKFNQEGPFVLIVQEDNTVAQKPIKLGDEQGTQVIITEGIEAADRIITDGHLRLAPGIKVDPKS